MKDKRGLSGVVAVMILVMLTVSLVSIIWVVVNKVVKQNVKQSSSCFGIFDKITIDNSYTCYDSQNNELQFAIDMGDIDVDKVVISITSGGNSRNFELANSLLTISDLRGYPNEEQVKLPEKNSGRTYLVSGFSTSPDSIKIAPVVNGHLCDVSDSLNEIDDCLSLS